MLCTDERSPTLQTFCLFFICSLVCEYLGGLGSLATGSVTAVSTSMRAFASAFNFSSIDTEAEFLNYKINPLNFVGPPKCFIRVLYSDPTLSPLSETGGRVSPCSLPKTLIQGVSQSAYEEGIGFVTLSITMATQFAAPAPSTKQCDYSMEGPRQLQTVFHFIDCPFPQTY